MLARGGSRMLFGLMAGMSALATIAVTPHIQIQGALLCIAGTDGFGILRLDGMHACLRLLGGSLVVMGTCAGSGTCMGTGLGTHLFSGRMGHGRTWSGKAR